MSDNKRKLYDALSQDYDMGTFEQFSSDIENPEKRRKLYDATIEEYDFGDYDSFSKQLGFGNEQPKPSLDVEQDNVVIEQPVSVAPTVAMPTPKVEDEVKQDNVQNVKDNNKFGTQFRSGMPQVGSDAPTKKLAELDKGTISIPKINTELPNMEGVFEREQNLKDANRGQVSELAANIEQQLNRRGEELDAEAAKNPIMMQAHGTAQSIPSFDANRTIDPEYRNYNAAKRAMENAQSLIDAADANTEGEGFFGGVGRGFGEKFFDLNTYDMGMGDLSDNTALLKALDAYDKGELTPSQQALLDAKAVELATTAYFGSEVGRGYKAGKATAESIPFMIEMAINPAKAVGQGLTQRLARFAIDKFGKKKALQAITKAAGRAVGDLMGASAMTATTGAIRTAADAARRMQGDIDIDIDKNGEAFFAGYTEGDSLPKAAAKAFANTTIENYSEMVGEYFAPVIGMGTSFGRKALDKVHLGKVNDFIDNVAASDVARAINQFENYAKWNGTIGEFAEEMVGGALNAAIVGDQKFDSSEEGIFNGENMADIALSVGLMGGFFSSIKTTTYPFYKIKANRAIDSARVDFKDAFGDKPEFNALDEALSSNNLEQAKIALAGVLADESLKAEDKEKAVKYAQAIQRYNGAVRADQKRREELQTPEQNEVEASFEQGYDLNEPQQMNDAQLELDAASDELRRVFGLAEDEDIDAFLGDDPLEGIILSREMGANAEEQHIKLNYLNAKAKVEGMYQKVRDDIGSAVEQSNKLIESRVNKDTQKITPATLKAEDRQVYIVAGDVVMFDDGSAVNTGKSSKDIIVKDANTGKLEMLSSNDVLRVDASLDPKEEATAAANIIREEYATTAANKIDGVVPFAVGDEYAVVFDDGTQHTAKVVADNGDGNVQVQIDNEPQATVATKEQVQQMVNAANKARIAQSKQSQVVEQPIAEETQEVAPEQTQEVEQVAQPQTEEATQAEQAPRVVPMLKDGVTPDFNAMDSEMFVDEYVSRYGEDNAVKIARKNIAAAKDNIAKIDKKIDDVLDPNQMGSLYTQRKAYEDNLNRYNDILGRLGASEDANETEADQQSRLKKEAGNRIASLFPNGMPNVESFILADIATGNRLRWSDKTANGAVTSKGLGAELGLSEAERRKRLPLIGKEAMTPEEYAESLKERLESVGIRYDESSLRDAVLNVYSSVDSRNGAWKALESIANKANEQEADTDWESMQQERAYKQAQSVEENIPELPNLETIEEETPISEGEYAEMEAKAQAEEQKDYDAMMAENPPVEESVDQQIEVAEQDTNPQPTEAQKEEQENVVEKKVNTPTKQTNAKAKKLLIEPTKPDYTTVVAPSMVTMEVPMNVYKYVSKDKLNMYSGVYFDKDKYLVATDLFNLVALKVRDMQRSDADKFVTKQLEKKAEGTFNWRDILVPADKSIDGVIDFVDIVGKVGKKAKKNEKPKAVRIAYNGESILIPAERLQPLADFQKAVGIGDIRFANIGKDNNIPKIQINAGANVALAVGLDPKVAPYWSVYEYEVGGELTPPTSEKQESAPVEDVTPKAEVPDVIRGDKWNATGEPTKMKFNRKGDNFDGYITVGKKKYGRTTSEGEELEILYEDYGNLENAWNAYERGDVFISPNLASIVKAVLVDRYGDMKDTAEVDDGQQILFRSGDDVTENGDEYTIEEQQIIDNAKANGTYLKAPNGKDTNLTPKQWVQVRTKAFKEWFGDWEKDTRIEKLRKSKDAEITGNEIEASEDLKEYRKNALKYGKTLRGEYVNKDTNEAIVINKDSLTEVLHHDGSNIAHIQSVAAIPQMVESGIYITSEPISETASKKMRNAKVAHYYVCGLKIGGIPYTVKFVVAEFESGDKYYDHSLTEIEKGELLNRAELSSTVADSKSPVSDIKDKRLISILQTNSSKIVDANGEPKVVYHRTPNKFTSFNVEKIGSSTDWGAFGKGFYFSPDAEQYRMYGDKTMALFLNARNPLMLDDKNAFDVKESFFKDYSWGKDSSEAFTKWVKDNGYDAVIYNDGYKEEDVVFKPNQIKSATDNIGTFDVNNDDIRFRSAETAPVFYSNAERAVENVKQEKATPEQWLKMIEKNGGLKAGEDKWLGLSDWLKSSDKKTLTKQEVLDFIKENEIQIEEVEYSNLEDSERFKELSKEYRDLYYEFGRNGDAAFAEMVERYGDDFELGFAYSGDELVIEEPYGVDAAESFLDAKTINSTRLGYTTDGLDNKREIALVVPTIESWNESDDIHFGDAGDGRAIAWVRFGETTIPVTKVKEVKAFNEPRKLEMTGHDVYAPIETKNSKDYVVYGKMRTGEMAYVVFIGENPVSKHNTLEEARLAMNEYYKEHKHYIPAGQEKVLVIDEVQSKRHQEGREKGYVDANIKKRFAEVQKQRTDFRKQHPEIATKVNDALYGRISAEEYKEWATSPKVFDLLMQEEALDREYNNLRDALEGVPYAPFEKNWAELAMKRMLRYAAENGFDKIAWTTGEQQAERYDLSKSIERIVAEDNTIEEASDRTPMAKEITLTTAGGMDIRLSVDANGIVRGREYDGKKLSDVVGKPLADKLMQEGYMDISGEGLKVGGEGMKAFYDQMIPSFMNKYGKKWGVKVQDVTLPYLAKSSSVMHSIDVTDAMRESVMQGQPMFRIANFDSRFNDLQSEYDTLDKNDEQALNEWRNKKRDVVEGYLNHIKNRFGMRSELVVFNGADEAQMQDAYNKLVGAYAAKGYTNPPKYEAFKEHSMKPSVVATYRKKGDIITFNVSSEDSRNRKIKFASTLFHENAHRIAHSLYNEQELAQIWEEAKDANHHITKEVESAYKQKSDARKGNEFIGKSIGYLVAEYNPMFLDFVRGRNDVSAQDLIKKLNYKNRTGKFVVEEILNVIKDEYQNQFTRRDDSSSLGGVRDGRGSRDVGGVSQSNERDERRGRTVSERQRARVLTATTLAEQLGTKVTIIESLDEITDANERTLRAKRGSKAWYDLRTGEVVIVIPNATSVEDVQRSVFHEVVAHKGLRDVVGRERFNAFLDKVYRGADADTRKKITEIAAKNGWNFRVATEEYLASLAERGFEDKENRSFWEKVRDLFMDMLREAKIALGYDINDNDLRYMLWRTYQMQKSKGVMAAAEDVLMQQKLGVGNFRTRPVGEEKVRFRSAGDQAAQPTKGIARQEYDKAVRRHIEGKNTVGKYENVGYKIKEAYMDSMLSVKKLQEAILKEAGGKLLDSMDAYTAENQLSSKNKAEMEAYERDYANAMMEQIGALLKDEASYEDIVDYMLAKHGLERNIVFSIREAEKRGGIWDGVVTTDYAGLTELTGEDKDFTKKAQEIVNKFENKHKTDALWKAINAATKASLKKSYDSGMMDKETYNNVSTMFNYYIPLRGWDNNNASNHYEYIGGSNVKISPALKTAKGRKSRADDPIATILLMGQSSIVQGNRNLMKQRLLNLALAKPTSLLTVQNVWYVKQADGTWRPEYPEIPENATGDEVDAIIKKHEAKMESLGGNAKKSKQGLALDYRTTAWEGQEHTIRVLRNGKEYLMFVNGNPNAAQAINGFTNPSAAQGKFAGVEEFVNKWTRVYGGLLTSQNPAFMFSNLSRDLIFAGTAVAIKEDAKYAAKYTKNIASILGAGKTFRLLRKWEKGTLDTNKEVERYFKEFLENGGETGFTNMQTLDDYKRNVESFLKKAKGSTIAKAKVPFENVLDYMEKLNRGVEDMTRFAVYMTSRQSGRSITQSVANAKDITVNFNKKGRGNMGAGVMNLLYLFFNATMQSLNNFGGLFKNHPLKATAAASTMVAAGMLVPMLMAAWGDDDEEYYNLPDWVRRNNLCFRIPTTNVFITIPLPHELRPFYGVGEIFASVLLGKMSAADGLKQAAQGFVSLSPIDFLGNDGDLRVNLTPSLAQPLAQLAVNKDYFGTPIQKETPYNELNPAWMKAYKGTNAKLVEVTKVINTLGSGEELKSGGWLDWSPAKIEHFFESYLGGMGKTLIRAGKTISMLWNEDAQTWRNVPILSSFVYKADERNKDRVINDKFDEALDEAKDTAHTVSQFKKAAKDPNQMTAMEYAEKLDEFMKSPTYKRYSVINEAKKKITKAFKELDNLDKTDRKAVEDFILETKLNMFEELEKLDEQDNQ